MNNSTVWLMILGVSAVSLLPRILPVAFFSSFEFPPVLIRWLSYIAPSVLAALAALSVLAPGGQFNFSISNLYLWAFIPTFITAIMTRSLFYSLLAGIGTMAILNNLM